MPDALRADYGPAFARALQPVYLSAACLVLLAFALSWFLENHPLSPR
ncbi:hypothetical protein [Paraburkholderia phenoliruptrix]|nr:hypothetical protein [Paraburkholderia phenoliruptrix]